MVVYCAVCDNKEFTSDRRLKEHCRNSKKHRLAKEHSNIVNTQSSLSQPSFSPIASKSTIKAIDVTPGLYAREDRAPRITTTKMTQPAVKSSYCNSCRLVFPTTDQSNLQLHYKSDDWHPDCPRCGDGFGGNNSFTILYECVRCNVRFASAELQKKHYRDTGSPSHAVCDRCSEAFENQDDLLVHTKRAHPSVFCEPCQVNVFEEDLDGHWTESSKHPTCCTCNISLDSEDTFTKHILESKIHADLCCRPCEFASQTLMGLQEHFNATVIHPKCLRCNTGFSTLISLRKHVCPVPGLIQIASMQTQVKQLSSPPQDDMKRSNTGKPVCERCDRQFKNDASIIRHYRDHPAHPTCHSCDVGFEDAAAYDLHVLSVHPSPSVHTHVQQAEPEEPAAHASDAIDVPAAVNQPEARPHDVSGEVERVAAPNCTKTEYTVPECPVMDIPPSVVRPPLASVVVPSVQALCDATGEGATAHQSSEPQSWAVEDNTQSQSCHWTEKETVESQNQEDQSTIGLQNWEESHSWDEWRSCEEENVERLSWATEASVGPLNCSGRASIVELRAEDTVKPPTWAHESSFKLKCQVWAKESSVESQAYYMEPISVSPHIPSKSVTSERYVPSNGSSSSNQQCVYSTHAETNVPPIPSTQNTHIEDDGSPTHALPSRKQERAPPGTTTGPPPPSRPALAWNCSVCAQPPTAPTATLCGHLFCISCILLALQKSGQCPVCRHPVLVHLHA